MQRTILTIATLCASTSFGAESAEPFSYEKLVHMAEEMGGEPHVPPTEVGPAFRDLTYDRYRLIAPRFEQAIWRKQNLPFWVEPHHGGFLFPYRKTLSIVHQGEAEQLEFDPGLFQYRGAAEPLATAEDGAFAGFRVLTRFGDRPNPQEFASFLGASYFRVLGSRDWYGASTRGLAIDVGLGTPEEFPRFTDFWIQRPELPDEFRVWALLDSPAVAGAYEFVLRPGEQSTVDVRARLYFRHGVQKLGLAPITSMWMWEAWNKPADEARAEVHDSDGLLVHHGDRWAWRPLRRPQRTVISKFPTNRLRGFGLMQRDREYENYADNEARYQLRPNVWVTPRNDWGPGHVELLELPSNHEGFDNVGAYWVQERPTFGNARISLDYRLTFGQREPDTEGMGRFTHTIPRATDAGSHYYLVIEGGEELPSLNRDNAEPFIEPIGARLGEVRFEQQPDRNWVLSFDLLHEPDQIVDVSAEVRNTGQPVTEKWRYRWTP